MMDKPYRSVIKAFSRRITQTMNAIIISFIISGKLEGVLPKTKKIIMDTRIAESG